MSWTKRQFIEEAFDAVGLSGYTYDLQPEQFESALRKLDAMVATWNAQGIRISYPMPSSPENSDLDAETNVPDSANEAIISGLGVKLAEAFGKTVSPDMKQRAYNSHTILLNRNASVIERQLPSTMPAGAGNRRSEDPFIAPPVEHIEVGPDDILEVE